VRKHRITIGDRLFVAFRYRVADATPSTGARTAGSLRKGAELEGELTALGDLAELDIDGIKVIVEGDLAAFASGEKVRVRLADDGAAYVIPTR
jgi:hypothetical protein